MAVNITKPTVGADVGTWGTELNAALDVLAAGVNAEETARAAADTALDGRLDVLEAAPSGTYPPVAGIPESDLDDALTARVTSAVRVVEAGMNLSTARPTGSAAVYWRFGTGVNVGTLGVNIVNALPGDTYFVASA